MGAVLALLVHGVLIGALALGVSWRSHEPDAVQAELWAAVPQAAAPRAAPPPPPPPAEELVPPRPAPPPPPAPPPRLEPPPPVPDAQIAIEQAKRDEQARQAKLAAEKKAAADKLAEAQKRLEAEKRLQAEKKAQEKQAEEKKAQERLAQQKAAQEKAAQDKRERQKREEAARAEAAAQAKLEQDRKENLARIVAQAGTGSAGSTGTAAQSSGPSATYAGRIKARIMPNIVFAETLAGNPMAEVEVRLAPDGRIISQRLVRSSGSREWDSAVQRAIERTETLPRDVDGRVPSTMVIAFRPQD